MDFITAHSFWFGVGAYWLFCSAVDAMPDPTADSSGGYTWAYKFLHTISGNLSVAFASKIPGVTLKP